MKKESTMRHIDRQYSQLDITIEDNGGLVDLGRTGSNAFTRNAANLRESLAQYFETVGAVPWQ